tara:strand:+ start:568 stop:1692 length:1125 start_codon:yes stop_codon:yes gene_type:complete
MKILYVSHHKEGTGWGQAAVDYIMAMDAAGLDIVPRAVKINRRNSDVPKRILQLEQKSSKGCDVCIQHVLPHMMEYSNKFDKNIALYATETDNFNSTSWSRYINNMDEAWVINSDAKKASLDSGVNVPIKIVPHASDISKFGRDYPVIDLPNSDTNFTFYFIGDMNKRKNLEAFIKAFHIEFGVNEPVTILIKTNSEGLSPEDCAAAVKTLCMRVKKELKLHKDVNSYKEDYIITDYLSEDNIYGIHNSCDCFVMPSYGEAWCIPAFDAMGFGKTPICTNAGGMKDFIGDGGILVDGRKEPVTDMGGFFDLNNAKENWTSIDINALRKSMREVYNLHKTNNKRYFDMKKNGFKKAKKYSYKKIGHLIKEILNAK